MSQVTVRTRLVGALPLAREEVASGLRLWPGTARLRWTDLLEALAVGIALVLYYLVRGNVVDRPEAAMTNAVRVIELERALGMFREIDLQQAMLPYRWAVYALNYIYFYLHWPVIATFAIWLFLWRRGLYPLVRNAFLISGGLGLIAYNLLPVAPPRLMPEYGFVDTLKVFFGVSYEVQMGAFVNSFAAVPSLHFGWAALVGAGLILASRQPAVWVLAAAYPAAQLLAIVATGNHYFLDAAAGLLAAVVAFGLAFGLDRLTRRRSAAAPYGRIWRLALGYGWKEDSL